MHDYLAAFASLGIMDMEGLWKISFDDAEWFAHSAVTELPEIKMYYGIEGELERNVCSIGLP